MEERNLFNSIVAEVKSDILYKTPISQCPVIRCSKDVYTLMKDGWDQINYRERFAVLYLNRGNRVVAKKEISAGSSSGTVVDVKAILKGALDCGASSIILMHNHPSGTLNASSADINITQKIKDAAKLLDLSVLDHVILTSENYHSMADEGDLPL